MEKIPQLDVEEGDSRDEKERRKGIVMMRRTSGMSKMRRKRSMRQFRVMKNLNMTPVLQKTSTLFMTVKNFKPYKLTTKTTSTF